MSVKYQQIIDNLKVDGLKPIYLVHGSELFYVDAFVQKVVDIAIPDFEKGFNEYILYGKDIGVGDILNYARKFPMMADRQLIVIKEAHLLSDLSNKESLTMLENYAKNPLHSTILVLCFGKPQDERKTWLKAINVKGEVHNFKKLYDNEVPDFIINLCNQLGLKISPKAVQLLAEHIGNNLQSIYNEIEKLKLNLKPDETLDASAIEKYVGISKEFNVFELQKAILDRNVKRCYQIVDYFGKNAKDHPIQPNIIVLYNFFSKILLFHAHKNKSDADLAKILGVNPYFLKDYRKGAQVFSIALLMHIVHVLNLVDQKSKGIEAGSLTEADLYRDLIFAILN
jgi:DNA polymerase III subunit delta